ncbi:uncharacterized protein LOC123537349 [Mercenaria mercenaria]|uniref:uncharacterized protein LOC123537349 n=1 Tax=Mercenaria mercenaria TaxID=6596 RepID=UPI00234F5A9C|nr:uncharacterized protein LOC123537349 [Mercenaria mercenaria]
MFQAPDYMQTVSLRLSEVLVDIGVDERIVQKRRRTRLLEESVCTISLQLQDLNSSTYILSSQSEGSTTIGLESDDDKLTCYNAYNVLQDWSEWQPSAINYLMIQDETVSPGYCLLQRLRNDVPLPYNDTPNEHHFRDKTGRILLKNTITSLTAAISAASAAIAAYFDERLVRHGPADRLTGRQPGYQEIDIVLAYQCKSWPLQARQWLNWQGACQWPSDDMKRYCSNSGCFVVGVGSKGSDNEELEWRITTSLAERCLMFNLNITQIRCYVWMKIMLKTFIKPLYKDTISSFMCKTVLFQLIANTHSDFWRETNLLVCLSSCLFVLYNSVLNENCPHFIIPGNDLMAGHIAHESKPHVLEILQFIIYSEGTSLLGIKCDGLGSRLQLKLNNICLFKTSAFVSAYLLKAIARMTECSMKFCLYFLSNSSYEVAILTLLKYIVNLVIISNQCQALDKTACSLFAPRLCTTLGSILASLNIQQYNGISEVALTWISLGLNTDVASSKLKLASMFYSIGEWNRTLIVLRDIEGVYDQNFVEPICGCYDQLREAPRRGFCEISDIRNEEALQYATAFCVLFLPCEINCIPAELQYELFCSIDKDINTGGMMGSLMYYAAVDSLPYLYFLQYKNYSFLGRQDDKQRALSNLIRTLDQEPNLGHRETALNLLGQCMEQENRAINALRCYSLSLNLRGRGNAANIHMCRLLSTMVNGQARNLPLL